MAVAKPIVQPRGTPKQIALLAAAHFTNDTYAHYLSVLLPLLVLRLDISVTLAGLLVTTYQLTSSVTQPIIGYLVDRFGLRWMSFAGLALCGVAMASLALMPSFALLLPAVALGGLGASAFHPASATMAAAAAGSRRGSLMSVYLTSGNFGLAMSPLILSAALAAGDTRYVPLLAVPALVLSGLLLRNLPPGLKAGYAGPPLSPLGALRSGGLPMLKMLTIVTFRAVISVSLTGLLPLLFELRGQGRETGAVVLSVYLLCGALGGLVGGNLSDRFGRMPVIIAPLALAPIALWAILNMSGPLLWIGAGIGGFFMSGSWVVLTVKAQELMPRSIGMASGLMLGLSQGIGGLAVAPIAALGDRFGLEPVLNALIVLPLVCAAIAATVDRGTAARAVLSPGGKGSA